MQVGGKNAPERIPRLGPGVDPARLALTPAEGYLLSRIDGRTSWSELRQIGGLPPAEVERCLGRWLSEGVLVVSAAPQARESKAAPGREPAPARRPAPSIAGRPELDPSLDIPLELQRRILEFGERLDAPYHEILGVPRDADRKALRHAYFQLSKELHPDRYFRRNLGPFAKRLERVFGRVVEAYELLSDPTARAEIERSLAAAAPANATPQASPAAAAAEAAPERAGTPPPRRRPHVFSVPSRMLKERKARAKRFFESGMAAYGAGRWLEAAGAVRLAIAHDPWNAAYKEQFVEVHRRAHDERAKQLVKEAESALELRDYASALRSFEEALQDRPHDADLLRRAARLSFASGGDLRQAKEWAAAAVEIEPRDAAAHRLLGQIFKAAGLEANARRELEIALELDPKDEEARAELRASGPLQALRRLGGKRWVG
ncbi:MAG TPA: DnaJ domain-containing protein [Myxococcota bacterium]|nr:DnaJ domain-containing protein [Myxococcota bacterium]